MKPRRCKNCNEPAVHPPEGLDLQASVFCTRCGFENGSWRSLETSGTDVLRSDLRSSRRARSIFGARIVFNNRCSTVECTVRDFSAQGARLLISSHVTIPDEFVLEIPKKGREYRSRLVWRMPSAVGIRFIP
jgi:hypothetical protein